MKIDSFKVDHTKMLPGIFVSRKDKTASGDVLTTFDIRMKKPNYSMIMPESMHTIEHLGATFLRNKEGFGSEVVYFGPMGCATGFYLVLKGDKESKDIACVVTEMMEYIAACEDTIPGATKEECGNYAYHNLADARLEARCYLQVLNDLKQENLYYN